MSEEYIAKINDFHMHTAISPCAPRDSKAMDHISLASRFGLTKIGFSDHAWDMDVPGHWDFYEEQGFDRILSIKDTIEPVEGLQVFVGCEVDMREDCTIAMLPEHMKLFDYVLIPTDHFHMNRNTPEEQVKTNEGVRKIMLDRFTAAVESVLPDYGRVGLCHPFFGGSFGDREKDILGGIPDSKFIDLFTVAAKRGIYIELNACVFRPTYLPLEEHKLPGEYVRIYTLARECGCRIYFGSDSHSGKVFETTHKNPDIERFAEVCGFTYCDLV